MEQKNQNTKEALILVAHQLFAERGYEGVSIAEIAGELEISKQALLHHFGNKEKLYGKVLEALSKRFDAIIQVNLTEQTPAPEQLQMTIRDLYKHMLSHKDDARLIMRELLENQPRIKDKQKWYLRPFLEKLTDLLQQTDPSTELTRHEAFARTYQILGAVHYFGISDPTLKHMFGEKTYENVEAVFLKQLESLIVKS